MRWRDLLNAVADAERAAGVSFDQYEVTVGNDDYNTSDVDGIEVIPGIAVRIVADLPIFDEGIDF